MTTGMHRTKQVRKTMKKNQCKMVKENNYKNGADEYRFCGSRL